jgi:hypothetical protein
MRHIDLLTPAVIGIGLSMDCFAISLAIGTTPKTWLIYAAAIIAISFAAFQARYDDNRLDGRVTCNQLNLCRGSLDWINLLTIVVGKMIRDGV